METTLDNKFFSFDTAKVQALTLDQLERTHKENDCFGNPIKGIYHYALMQSILDICKEQGYETDVWDMFAAQNKDRTLPGVVVLPQVEAQYGEKAIEAHILRRVYANIRIHNFDTDEYTTNLAVAFHQRGIQVGFGNNVIICHNQCMLSPSKYIATYSDRGKGRQDKVEIPEILSTVRSWLLEANHQVVKERKKIEMMKDISVDADTMFRLIGLLTAIRVKSDTLIKEIRDARTYPLNQAQITKFTEDMILRYHTNNRISVWDLYDSATSLYKAQAMDMPAILPQNMAMVEFLDEQFSLPTLS